MLNKNGNSKFPFYLPQDFFLESKKGRKDDVLPEILFLTTFPPRQCGIATYSEDLIKAMEKQFVYSFDVKVCALETDKEQHTYEDSRVKYVLNTSNEKSYQNLVSKINSDDNIKVTLIQHEFGLFADNTQAFNQFLVDVKKPVAVVFHTVLPRPDQVFKAKVQHILDTVDGIIVMTDDAAEILTRDYRIEREKITVIPHGTHLVPYLDKDVLKKKYAIGERTVLSTFGLLSSGKSIETTLDALPTIAKTTPDVLFLIIGKTHPTVVLNEGEQYREMLKQKIVDLGIEKNVRFVNEYLPLDTLLEYLQLTDIYLFTSKDPNQAVSGTFSYALSCGCPVVSTPIPHAKEFLKDRAGLVFDFGNSQELAEAVNRLIFDVELRQEMISNGLHKITGTAWENSAVKHAKFLQKIAKDEMELHYRNPKVNLEHIKKMTTNFGMLQFSKINQPDINSGYTIDDNARAMIALIQHYKFRRDTSDLKYIGSYLNYIAYCERPDNLFMNYVDMNLNFTDQNTNENLEDSTGRAIWSLGYLISQSKIMPTDYVEKATEIFERVIQRAHKIHSPRAMAFMIKGLYYYNRSVKSDDTVAIIGLLANRLVELYKNSASSDWAWFEGYLTYANSVLPEALLCAYTVTANDVYKDIAKKSFDFLLEKTFCDDAIKVISNRSWLMKGGVCEEFGEQPIDIAYTVITLRKFHDIFKDRKYLVKMEMAFNWFLGNNHLQQIIYNPCTGGCFDGLEEHNVNLNQGAESTVSYLMARMMIDKYFGNENELYHRRKSRSYKDKLTVN
ncbi:MAG: glycosyltransferase [Flavobacterium sp.]|nr:MAG: glycosyltransferase [Flavobacterium sp.]